MDSGIADGAAASLIVSDATNDSEGRPPLFHYVYASPTDAASKEAEERSEHLKGLIEFGTISVNKDPTSQGLEPASFDVVMLSTLGENQDLGKRLVNARKFLKPGGKLFVVGIANQGLGTSLMLRCLQTSR